MIKAFIFDLDGVLVDTAQFHYQAWNNIAEDLGFSITLDQNEQLKGVSRVNSLEMILNWGKVTCTQEEKQLLLHKKNESYLNLVQTLSAKDLLPGVANFLNETKENKIAIAVGSASKNAQLIIDKLKISHYFDVVIDGNKTKKSKPHPEVFLLATQHLGIAPKETIVFEDATSGVQAALAGGFKVVGVGDSKVLASAHLVISGFANLCLEDVLKGIGVEISS